mmetsp:Transcript_2446/g.5373  ORF Transcript_2446/g.5373 Transcript_2446/m.5373 type:complete len:427 (-) Transcript_2446:13-1293(-)
MTSLPDEVYNFIAGSMYTASGGGDNEDGGNNTGGVHYHKLADDIELYNLAEGTYDMDQNFPFAKEDQDKIPEDYPRVTVNKTNIDNSDTPPVPPLLAGMRFGLCLVRIHNKTNTSSDDHGGGGKKSGITNVLLDAGVGPWIPDVHKCSGHPVPCEPPHALPQLLASISLSMDDIEFVVHSHCHGDHVGWVGYFPKAVHILHQREYDFATYTGCPWRNDAVERFAPLEDQGRLRLVGQDDNSKKSDNATEESNDSIPLDEKIPQISLRLIDGHTPGHVAVEIQSQINPKAIAIYIGDAMHFSFQVTRPDIVPLFDCCAWKIRPFLPVGGDEGTQISWSPRMRQSPSSWNATTSVRARSTLLKRLVDRQALLVSPHFAAPGMGYIATIDDNKTEQCEKDDDETAVAFRFKYNPLREQQHEGGTTGNLT